MRLTTTIQNESSDSTTGITIDKFFQFIIFGDIIAGECHVTIFNAVSFHFDKSVKNPRMIVRLNINDDENIIIKHDDMSNFYSNSDVIKQFWGKDSKHSSSHRDLIDRLTESKKNINNEIKEDLISILNNNGSINGSTFISENKENIREIIIHPCSIKEKSGDISLDDIFTTIPPELKEIVSNGYWFKTTFKHKIENNHQGFKIKACVELKNAKFKSSDFKIYIQTNKKYDIKDNNSKIDENNVSIEKVYSQNSLKYFKEWKELGIYKSSLFRLSNNHELDNHINKKISNFTTSIQFEDIFAAKKREISILIFSIFLSLIYSIGLDYTRQESLAFKSLFPVFSPFSIDILWLIACLSLATKFLLFRYKKINIIIKILIFLPSCLWFFSYFTFEFDTNRYTCTDLTYANSILCLSYLQIKLYCLDLIIFICILAFFLLNHFKVFEKYDRKFFSNHINDKSGD